MRLGRSLFKRGDQMLIDRWIIDGGAGAVAKLAAVTRRLQTGLLYHYAFAMIIGLVFLVGWVHFR
ncbi:MAG: hypothetical protein LC632_09075 [Xanthomonadaceae bacterium]|nr:hypothetical protein [Xanthomonadaceae bacterium]